jgi:transcription antitermination factor NusG
MTTYTDRMMSEPLEPAPFSEVPSSEAPWYVVQTRYRFETRIAAQLQTKGIETFLPVLSETHRWSDRQKIISLPLFAGYVFVRLHPSAPARARVLRTEGVMGFVNAHGDASPVPSRQIEDLRRLPRRSGRRPGGEQSKDAGDLARVHSAVGRSHD